MKLQPKITETVSLPQAAPQKMKTQQILIKYYVNTLRKHVLGYRTMGTIVLLKPFIAFTLSSCLLHMKYPHEAY